MTIAPTASGFRGYLRSFARNRDGVSAVEFAIVLPFMLTLYLGGVEVGDGLAIDFKATIAARTVVSLASLYINIDSTAMSNILGAASTVVSPYSASNMVVTLSEITTNANGQGTITWSASLNGTARTVGSSVTLPTALKTANISLLWGEVTYPYTPTMGYVLTGTINIYQDIYFYPRMSSCVTYNNVCS